MMCVVLSAVAAGACSKNDSNPVTPTCTVTAAAPSSSSFGPEGGTGTVAVTGGTGCSWTAASNASFITISQGATGSGNGSAQFTVAANTTAADRSGTIAVAGSTFTITQRATATINPVTIGAPTASSPIGGTTVTGSRPTLVVNNAAIAGTPGTVTYRFEVSDQSSFPADPARTFSVDGVAQGSGTTSGVIPRDLGPSVLWYWHARATNGTVTGAYSATETFRTASTCNYVLSATSFNASTSGDNFAVTVTTDSACAWTAVSNASFITLSTAGFSGTNNVVLTVAANTGGVPRTGTVTIAGQTVTVTQGASGVVVGFNLIDNGRGPQVVTECQVRSTSTPALPSTCTLQSTSFPLGTTGITDYSWTVSYDAPFTKTFTQSGTSPTMTISETCGQNPNTPSGQPIDLRVTLVVTTNTGEAVTVRSGSGSQPPLTLRMFTCGF